MRSQPRRAQANTLNRRKVVLAHPAEAPVQGSEQPQATGIGAVPHVVEVESEPLLGEDFLAIAMPLDLVPPAEGEPQPRREQPALEAGQEESRPQGTFREAVP